MRPSPALIAGVRAISRALGCIRRVDALLALVAFAALLTDPLLLHKVTGLTPALVVLAFVAAVPLLMRSRFPLIALAAEVPLLLGCLAVAHPNRAATGIVIVLVFTVGLEGGRVRSLVVGALMAALMVIAVSLTTQQAEPFEVVAYTALVLAALIAGEALRARQALQRTLVQEAALASAADAQHRFDTERLALAHELHDAVGHTLVAINVRAAASARRARRADGAELSALDDIVAASSEALAELRVTLKTLRAVQDGPAPLHPAHELASLDTLVSGVREAGVSVDLEIAGNPASLPVPLGHAVYHIIQEALTNVLRHSTAHAARVRLVAGGDSVVVEIRDEGRPPASGLPSAGHGLRGMRERAAALGGRCEAGPADGGGWRVRALIPVRETTTVETGKGA